MIVSVCILASVFCVSVFAAETDDKPAPAPAPANGVVLRISAEKNGKKYPVVVEDHTNFEDGWNAAMKLAADFKALNTKGYKRVIVDIYSDWKAVDGEFSDDLFNGKGFNWDTIYFPSKVNVTLNLNGHTVDRGLTAYQYNGEVMYVDSKANITINNGTIKGGWSCNGAGGIHINDGANVTLNNVNLKGNTVEDDDGAAIAVYGGATLTMNGGTISENIVYNTTAAYITTIGKVSRGVLYAQDANVYLKDVTFDKNVAKNISIEGLVAYFVRSTVVMDGCTVQNNGFSSKSEKYVTPTSYIYSNTSLDLKIKNTAFFNNGNSDRVIEDTESDLTSLMCFEIGSMAPDAYIAIENCNITYNKMDRIFDLGEVVLSMKDSTVTDNIANVAAFYHTETYFIRPSSNYTFENCTFNNNNPINDTNHLAASNQGTFCIKDEKIGKVTFNKCEFGDATFVNKQFATFKDSSITNVGSIFNEGSVTMLMTITALVASVASITLTVVYNKKKKAVAVNNDNEK